MLFTTEYQKPIQLWSERVRRREPSLVGRLILDEIGDLLGDTQLHLRVVIHNLIGYSAFHPGMRVDDVARMVGVCRRTVENQAREAGFSSLWRVLVVAQFVQIYPMLYDTSEPYKSLTKKFGYSSLGRLNKHCMQLTGHTVHDIREQVVEPDEVACLIAAVLRRPTTLKALK